MQNYEIIPGTVRKFLLTQVKVNQAKDVILYMSILTYVLKRSICCIWRNDRVFWNVLGLVVQPGVEGDWAEEGRAVPAGENVW